MHQTLLLCLLLLLAVLALPGCERKFTRERFDMLKAEVDEQRDVEMILGKPEFNAGDEWYYEDEDRHVSARIFFDEQGRVREKQWLDARTGVWEGGNPHIDAPVQGEARERHTKTGRIDED